MSACTLLHGCHCERCKERARLSPLIAKARSALSELENQLEATHHDNWAPRPLTPAEEYARIPLEGF